MKKKIYDLATLWLTLSVCFFLVEYFTEWLEVVTLGGLVAGSFIEGFFMLLGTGVMRLLVSRDFKQAPLARLTAYGGDLAKALIALAAFSWEGALTLSHVMPSYVLHTNVGHLLFLLLVYPVVALALDLVCKRELTNGN